MKVFANPDTFIRQLPIKKGDNILEVGVGAGRILNRIACHQGGEGRFVGLDLQEKMLQQAKKRLNKIAPQYIDKVEYELFDILSESVQPNFGTFDCIILVTVLGEIPNRSKVLSALAEALAPGGNIVIQEVIPDPCYITHTSLLNLAAKAGLKHVGTQKSLLNYISTFTLPNLQCC